MDDSRIIEALIEYLPIVDVARLRASSKQLASACKKQLCEGKHKTVAHQVLRRTASQLLNGAARKRNDPKGQSPRASLGSNDVTRELRNRRAAGQRFMAAFSWLEQLVDGRALLSPRNPHTAETVALLAPLVINFSEFVSQQQAAVLVEAGVRVGYLQLVAGARHSVSNMHVWMRVQRELGIAADVPAYAEKLAYAEGVSADDADGEHFRNLEARELVDVMLLAINAPGDCWPYAQAILGECFKILEATEDPDFVSEQDAFSLLQATILKSWKIQAVLDSRTSSWRPLLCKQFTNLDNTTMLMTSLWLIVQKLRLLPEDLAMDWVKKCMTARQYHLAVAPMRTSVGIEPYYPEYYEFVIMGLVRSGRWDDIIGFMEELKKQPPFYCPRLSAKAAVVKYRLVTAVKDKLYNAPSLVEKITALL